MIVNHYSWVDYCIKLYLIGPIQDRTICNVQYPYSNRQDRDYPTMSTACLELTYKRFY
jgi:hypothetical protein